MLDLIGYRQALKLAKLTVARLNNSTFVPDVPPERSRTHQRGEDCTFVSIAFWSTERDRQSLFGD